MNLTQRKNLMRVVADKIIVDNHWTLRVQIRGSWYHCTDGDEKRSQRYVIDGHSYSSKQFDKKLKPVAKLQHALQDQFKIAQHESGFKIDI